MWIVQYNESAVRLELSLFKIKYSSRVYKTINIFFSSFPYNDKDSYIGEREAASDYQIVTNFIVNPGYYDNVPEDNKKGYDRYDKLYEILQECDSVVENEEDAMDKLSTVGRRGWKVQGDSNAITVHSVIYNLTDKTALWIPNEHYGEKEYIFKFSVK